ncbi:cation diffusion facilitator family transporter [Stappia indica]|uniref:Protein p34 n=1 Tax=Stappia indica TaxID=538381 RepID=A0A285RX34_9HYPH|nr:cation diffusion facilitator family transporter [Stappia indica]MCC4244485.1 cation diffusion facilitator family transporter [Stappia indica]SOB98967.1 cation diffusion facilitator family transporter [Stappia indica]
MSLRLRVALASIFVGIAVLGLKYLAYRWTGSVALYSDALESIVNVASAVAAFLAVWFAAKPADSNHPYGHHKAEYMAAVLVGVLIVLAALSIAHEAWKNYIDPQPVEFTPEGLGVNALATVLNGIWATVLVRIGRSHRSLALVADGKHLYTDVFSSLGVLAGVILVMLTGIRELDSLLAGLVALNILWSGWSLMKESLGGLMDEAVAPALQDRIREVISGSADGAIEAHDLRTRSAGHVIFVDFHLVVPADMTVERAHDICDRIEAAISKDVPGARTTIHVEPEHKAKHTGIVVI